MEVWQIILIVLGSIILFLIGFVFFTTYIIYRQIFYNKPKLNVIDDTECSMMFRGLTMPEIETEVRQMIQDAANYPHEHIYVTSFDGLKLHGALYRFGDDTSPVMICFHGYRGNKFRDFAGAIKIFKKLKYNVLLVDQRAQHESEGKAMTFGVNESKDVMPWINKIIEIFGKDIKIAIEGLSMGGATVLMAASYEPLPKNVKCVVADCPFPSPLSIFEFSIKNSPILLTFLKPVSYLVGKLYMKVNFFKYDCFKDLKNNKLPILILHGKKDTIVPCFLSEKLKETYPEMITLELFENANHGVSYFDDTDRYFKVSEDFLQNNLK